MTSELRVAVVPTAAGVRADGAVVLPYFQDDSLGDAPAAAELGGKALEAAIQRGEVTARRYSSTLFHTENGPSLLVMGAGIRDEQNGLEARRLAAAAAMTLVGRGYRRLAFVDRGTLAGYDFARCCVEGAIYGAYDPALRKTREAIPKSLEQVLLISHADESAVTGGATRGSIVGEAISFARDLVNLPPNELTPRMLAQRALDAADAFGLGCEILDEGTMEKLGMGSLLGVAAGSEQPPRLVVLECGDPGAPVKLALAGKGVTFDSGGLSLKTGEGMMTMKGDMGGAAAVIAAMTAISQLRLAGVWVRGYAGCTENMPSGSAMRPGDVLTALNGETIEVLNTDAEGRLVLADVLAYAVRQGATHIVDVATLTGGAVVALGHEATLATGNQADWVTEVVTAAEAGLERAWPMPLYEEYRKLMDSDIADIKNTGGRYASALTAAAFLRDFVDKVRWTHLDIAGTAWAETATPYQQKGGTGAGVGTLVAVAERLGATETAS